MTTSTSPAHDPKGLEAYYTNTEHLLEYFRQTILASALERRLLVIHGIGGVGKSSLLAMFRLRCKREQVPVAMASGDQVKSAVDVLADWADDLKADAINLPAFKKAMDYYRAVEVKADDYLRKLAQDSGGKAIKTVIDTATSLLPGVGSVLGKLGGAGIDLLIGYLSKPDVDLLRDPTRKLTAEFLKDIADASSRHRLVLILDTFEQMNTLDEWTCDLAQRLPTNLLLVIAGRALPDWKRPWPEWLAYTYVEELKPMTKRVMHELVRRYYATVRGGQPDPKQVEAIIDFARGLPMVVNSAVQLWVQYGMVEFQTIKGEVIADLVDRLREGVPPELYPSLEAAAVVHWFDKSILRSVVNEPHVDAVYDELRRFPFVRPHPKGYALHDALRDMLGEFLESHDRERYRELHRRAAAYFETQLASAQANEAEPLGLERLYHVICADETAGVHLFQQMAEELIGLRLRNRMRSLVNRANTFPLHEKESRQWRDYYRARLSHLEEDTPSALLRYRALMEDLDTSDQLRAYVLSDYGEILGRVEYLKQPGTLDVAVSALSESTRLIPVGMKTVQSWLSLATVYRRVSKWDSALANIAKAIDYCRSSGNDYYLAYGLIEAVTTYMHVGEWRRALDCKHQALELLKAHPSGQYARAKILGRIAIEILVGNWGGAEREFRESIHIAKQLDDIEMLEQVHKRLGWVLGLQGKVQAAEECFEHALELANQMDESGQWLKAVADGFHGFALIRNNPDKARAFFQSSLQTKQMLNDQIGVQELLNCLGTIAELDNDGAQAEHFYDQAKMLAQLGRRHFTCVALIGLARVKHGRKNFAAVVSLMAEAEQLAQQYEYNDHLASVSLTQAHMAWDGEAPSWGNGFDAAFHHYQHTLIYALRYNRYLLDEVLWGSNVSTPLRTILPRCLEHSEEGRKMLVALRNWWQTGINDIGTPRSDTISPISEGISLLEAERIARLREPGDGSPQINVVDKIEAMLLTL